MKSIFDELIQRFGAEKPESVTEYQSYIRIPAALAVEAITHLKEVRGFGHLSFFTCVDRIEEDRFELLYMLHSYERKHDIGVCVSLPRQSGFDSDGKPLPVTMQGIHHLWAAAETYQRELREMYGVTFPGSPRVDDDFALEGWQEMPPMRRDFDTRAYSEKTYFARPGRTTTDTRQHMKDELYPSEAESW